MAIALSPGAFVPRAPSRAVMEGINFALETGEGWQSSTQPMRAYRRKPYRNHRHRRSVFGYRLDAVALFGQVSDVEYFVLQTPSPGR